MKKIILLSLSAVISMASFAQFSFGVQGTGNLSSAKIEDKDALDIKKKMKSMPGAGIVLQYGFSNHFAIRSGINYLQHGIELKAVLDESADLKIKFENNLNYVQVPLTFLYTVPVAGFQLFVGGGGFVNYGISGTCKNTTSYTMPDGHTAVDVDKLKAFKKEEDGGAGLKRTDFGATAIGGIRLPGGLFANVGYQLSLSNIAGTEDTEDDFKYKNRGLQLTIGYFFR